MRNETTTDGSTGGGSLVRSVLMHSARIDTITVGSDAAHAQLAHCRRCSVPVAGSRPSAQRVSLSSRITNTAARNVTTVTTRKRMLP